MYGLEDVRLNEVMAYVTGCTKYGFKGRMVVLWEMRVDDGRKKRPAGILCPFNTNSVYASVLVEERVHDMSRKGNDVVGVGIGASIRPIRASDAEDIQIANRTPGEKMYFVSSQLSLPL